MNLDDLRCTDCGGADNLISFWPGRDGQQATMFKWKLKRSLPEKCWCASCWQKRYSAPRLPEKKRRKVRADDS